MERRLFWPDLIRFTGCLLVILDHAAANPTYMIGRIPDLDWETANILNSFSRSAVPLFFMLSGYLFYSGKALPVVEAIRKRVLRLFLPLLFFSCLGVLTKALFLDRTEWVAGIFLLNKQYYHLWFFYMMIVVSLAAALVRPAEVNPRTGTITCLIVMILFSEAAKTVGAASDFALLNSFAVHFGYFLMGHWIGRIDISKPLLPFAAYLAITSVIASLTSSASHMAGRIDFTWYGNGSITVMLQGVALFLALKAAAPKLERHVAVSRPVSHIATLSLGIYGFHALVLDYAMEQQGFTGYAAGNLTLLEIGTRLGIAFAGAWVLSLLVKAVDKRGYVV